MVILVNCVPFLTGLIQVDVEDASMDDNGGTCILEQEKS